VCHSPAMQANNVKGQPRASFEFDSVFLGDALCFLRGVQFGGARPAHIFVQPEVAQRLSSITVSGKGKNMLIQRAVQRVAKSAGLVAAIHRGALLIGPPRAMRQLEDERHVLSAEAEKVLRQRAKVKRTSWDLHGVPLKAVQDDLFRQILDVRTVLLEEERSALARMPITIKIRGMPVTHAVYWLLKVHGLRAELRNDALVISRDKTVTLHTPLVLLAQCRALREEVARLRTQVVQLESERDLGRRERKGADTKKE